MTQQQAVTLKQTLESMFDHIAKKENVMDDLMQIEQLQKEIGPTTPPMLKHYLERRSYTKALEFLNTGDAKSRETFHVPHPREDNENVKS